MARRGKNARDSDSVSDPSEGEMDSDDSMRGSHRPKKKVAKKGEEKLAKKKTVPKKVSPKKLKRVREEDAVVFNQVDEEEDDEQRGLIQDYDEEDLLNLQVPDAPRPCMATDGGERLIITDITVENFKSYHGTRRIGPFHHSFTSIIGPNGSGKSNVIDALLFVFGYKASKIRSKKVAVLIHSSAGKDNITQCTVKISFQKIIDRDGGNFDVVENSGFSVSRTAYSNNSSEYRMDGVRTTFKEVAAKLKEVGIDLIHNRFLILQGEVEQIAMMKPKSVNGNDDGMLEYLEDIIGSSRYKLPIEKLSVKLEKLQVEKSHQISKVERARAAKDALAGPVDKTIECLSIENQVVVLNCKLYLLQKYNSQDELKLARFDQEKAEADLKTVTNNLAAVVGKLKEKREAIDTMTKAAAELQATIHNTSNELELLVQKDKKRENDISRLKNETKRLQAEAKREQEKLEETTKAPVDAKAKIEQLNIQLNEYKEELNTAQNQFDVFHPIFSKKTEADRVKREKLEEEYSDIAAKLADAESKVKLADSFLSSMMEDYEKKKKQLEDLEMSLKANKEKQEKDQKARMEIQATITKDNEERNNARVEMDEINGRSTQMRKRLDELAPMFSERQQEAQAKRNTSRITDYFDTSVKNGLLKGYIGRVGDLGSIDPKYDRAISNNFGGALDLYLVEDGRTATEGIELLKKVNLRSYFLSLDRQQRSWQQIKQIEAERIGPAPRLFNMIKCEDKYKPAFFYAVKWAYVVKTIDEAHKLHRQLLAEGRRETIVTMDGNQITAKGAFIGGGQVKEGKMGTAKVARHNSTNVDDEVQVEKIEEAKKEKEILEQGLMANAKRYHDLEVKINRMAPSQDRNASSLREIDRQIKSTEERILVQEKQKKERLKEMEKAKVDERELKRKQDEINQLTKERDDAFEASNEFKSKIKEIDNDIAKVYNKLVKVHETTMASARVSIEKTEKEMGRQQAIINSAERNIEKQRKRLNEVNKDVDLKSGKIACLKSDEDLFGKNRLDKEEDLRRLERKMGALENKLQTVRGSTSDLDSEEVSLEKQQKMLLELLREIKGKTKGLHRAMEEYSAKAKDLTLHNMALLLADIPEDKLPIVNQELLDDGSESEVEDETNKDSFQSPSSKKRSKEKANSKLESPRKKMRMNAEEDDDENVDEDGTDREGNSEMEREDQGMGMEIGEDDSITAADNEELRNSTDGNFVIPETSEHREDREANKLHAKREKRLAQEHALMNGIMPDWSRRHVQKLDPSCLASNVDAHERDLATKKKALTPHVLEDYKIKVERFRKESELLSIVKDKHEAHRAKLEGLKKLRLADFMGGFRSIATALRELYQMITLGGDAALEVKDDYDPFIEGVQFMVRPPKKSWKQIENLSGGEKTLSSLALVFALHKYRPTPLYVMDEIDAALDFRNVSIIGHYIKDRTKNAQFIIISLRNNMFELADRLIGIYKVHDCTRNVVVDPKRVLEETKELRSGLNKVRMLMESNKIQTGVGF